MPKQKGQSLVEILVAVAVFSFIVSAVAFLILDVYLADRAGREISQAVFLTEEGLEAARSIRDNNWDDLVGGQHGLALLGNNWIFQGSQDDLSAKLTDGARQITVLDLTAEKKQVTASVSWSFTESNTYDISMTTYLTKWQKQSPYCDGVADTCDLFLTETLCLDQDGCSWNLAFCGGTCTPCLGLSQPQCLQQLGCRWLGNRCDRSCNSCDSFFDQPSCDGQLGCGWIPTQCGGTPAACQDYNNQIDCLDQSGCNWVIP